MHSRLALGVVVAAAVSYGLGLAARQEVGKPCGDFAALHLPETTIVSAEQVNGPTFQVPGSALVRELPAFCRVIAVTKPAINFEVWLPPPAGTGSSRASATAAWPASSATTRWVRRCGVDTRSRARIPAT